MFQFVSILLLIIYLFEAVNFSTNFEKHCCIFEKKNKKIFEKSKINQEADKDQSRSSNQEADML